MKQTALSVIKAQWKTQNDVSHAHNEKKVTFRGRNDEHFMMACDSSVSDSVRCNIIKQIQQQNAVVSPFEALFRSR